MTETCLQYMFHVTIAIVSISCKSIFIILSMKWNLMFQNFHLKYFSTRCMFLIVIIKNGRNNDNFVWGMSLIWLLSKKTINFNTNAENSIWKRFYIIVNTEKNWYSKPTWWYVSTCLKLCSIILYSTSLCLKRKINFAAKLNNVSQLWFYKLIEKYDRIALEIKAGITP